MSDLVRTYKRGRLPGAAPVWLGLWAAAFCGLPCLSSRAGDEPVNDPATRHEIWVPSKELHTILQSHPNAVLLSPAEYEALIRDAGKLSPEKEEAAPVSSVIEGAKLSAQIPAGASYLTISAKVTLYHLEDGWQETKLLTLPQQVKLWKVNGKDLSLRGTGQQVLALRGRGRHEVELVYQAPVVREHGVCRAEIPLIARPLSVSLTPGEHVILPSRWPVHNGVAEVPLAAEKEKGDSASIYWLEAAADGAAAKPILFEVAHCLSKVDGVEVTTKVELDVESSHGILPEVLQFRLPDEAVHVVTVKDQSIASWTQKGALLEIHRTSGLTVRRSFSIDLTRPTSDAEGVSPVPVDVPRLEGVTHLAASVAVETGPGFETTSWQTAGTPLTTANQETFRNMAKPALLGTYASVHYDVAPDSIVVNVRRLADRYSADVDGRIKVSSHEVSVARVIAIHGDEGITRRAEFSLAEGEQFMELQILSGEGAEWKQKGDKSFEITWPRGLVAGNSTSLMLNTRQDVSAAAAEGKTTDKLFFGNIHVPAATRLAGYVALAYDDSWKVNAAPLQGLEARDVKETPVKGRMAWFTLRDYKLAVELSRNEPVLDAAVIAYALPRANNVEIEGQFSFLVSQAPLREFDVKLPVNVAALFHLDSPLIASQRLDEGTGAWHFTLRKELEGARNLRWHLSLPGQKSGSSRKEEATEPPGAEPTVLSATLPAFTLPAARHFSGQWVMEANTDTELIFNDTKGTQPLAPAQAARIDGYQPRHRVLAAFAYDLGEYSVKLTAIRHDPGALTSAVVEDLNMASVLSADGSSRHQADFRVKHNGLQFFGVRLPEGAVLLSAAANGAPVKPVQAGRDEVRVPLSVRAGEAAIAVVTVLYELPGETLGNSGQRSLVPPAIEDAIPVLTSHWRVYAPEGMEIKTEGGFAGVPTRVNTPTLWSGLVGPNYVEKTVRSGLAEPASYDPRPVLEEMNRRMISEIHFQAASFGDVMEFFRRQAEKANLDPNHPKVTGFALRYGVSYPTGRITLDLRNLPLREALNYAASAFGMKYTVEREGFIFSPRTYESVIISRTYPVPWNFLSLIVSEAKRSQEGDGTPDPFAQTSANPQTPAPVEIHSVQEALQACGIPFPQGASAVLDEKEGILTIRNTEEQIETAEILLRDLAGLGPLQTALKEDEARANKADRTQNYLARMQSIILPSVQFQGASLDEAVAFLRTKSREFDTFAKDPEEKGLNFVIWSGAAPSTAAITLDLSDVPLTEALRYITELANMKYKVEPYAILIVPPTDTNTEQFTRIFEVPPDGLGDDFVRGKVTALGALKQAGIQFPEGATATYLRATSRLIVKNTQPNLDVTEAFVDQMHRMNGGEDVVVKDEQGRPMTADALAGAAAKSPEHFFEEKLRKIIFPTVQFQGASIEEAIEFLRIKGKELDRSEPDPARRGVNLIVRPGSAPISARITLDLHEVPMVEALRYITELANMKYKIEPYAVVVVPPTDTNTEQFTRTFRVPPDFLRLAPSETISNGTPDPFATSANKGNPPVLLTPRPTAKSILEQAGIQFPEGATAIYIPATSQLSVKNTQPNLDIVEAFVDQLSIVAPRRSKVDTTPATKSGLISLELTLPTQGRVLDFRSHEKPVLLVLTYQSWEKQMAKAVLWMAVGAFLFWRWGRGRLCLATLIVAILLSLLPQIWFPGWMPAANAVLAGWLVLAVANLLYRIARWIEKKAGATNRVTKLQPYAN